MANYKFININKYPNHRTHSLAPQEFNIVFIQDKPPAYERHVDTLPGKFQPDLCFRILSQEMSYNLNDIRIEYLVFSPVRKCLYNINWNVHTLSVLKERSDICNIICLC